MVVLSSSSRMWSRNPESEWLQLEMESIDGEVLFSDRYITVVVFFTGELVDLLRSLGLAAIGGG